VLPSTLAGDASDRTGAGEGRQVCAWRRREGRCVDQASGLVTKFVLGVVALLMGAAGSEVVAPDRSLSIDRYRELGIPSLERAWSGADHDAAVMILRDLPRSELPRSGSSRSHALFERLVDTVGMLGSGNVETAVTALYGEGPDGLLFDRERVELWSAVARRALELLDEIDDIDEAIRKHAAQGVPPEARERLARLEREQAARAQAREVFEGYLIVSLAAVIEVGEKPATRPATRLLLRDELVELVPRAIHHLSDPRAEALREAIRVVASREENEAIRADLMGLTRDDE